MAHAAFRAAVQIQNQDNVAFDNLEMREGNAMPQRTGRYVTDNINNNNHHQATFGLNVNWINIGNSRANVGLQAAASPGCIAIGIDPRKLSCFWSSVHEQRIVHLAHTLDLSPELYGWLAARCQWTGCTDSRSWHQTVW